MDIDAIRVRQDLVESAEPSYTKYLALAAMYVFYTDYYSLVEPDRRRANTYTDLAINSAEKALEFEVTSAAYTLLAEGYAKKMTGPLSAIRFGGRLSGAIDKAEMLDHESEELLYLQAKRYLQAPALFGGDVQKAIEAFTELTQRNPHSTFYFSFLGESYVGVDTEKARSMLQRAVELAPNNAWAVRELQRL